MTVSTDATSTPVPQPIPVTHMFSLKEFQKGWAWRKLDTFFTEKELPVPGGHVPVFRCFHEIAPGVAITAIVWGSVIIVSPVDERIKGSQLPGHPDEAPTIDVEESFITSELIGEGFTQQATKGNNHRYGYHRTYTENTPKVESFQSNGRWVPYVLQQCLIGTNSGYSREVTLWLEPPSSGTVVPVEGTNNIQISGEFMGDKYEWTEDLLTELHNRNRGYSYGGQLVDTRRPEKILHHHLLYGIWDDDSQIQAFWSHFLHVVMQQKGEINRVGVKGLENRKLIKPLLDRLKEEEPVLFQFYEFLHDGRTVDKLKNNQLLAAFLKGCGGDYDKLVKGIKVGQDHLRNRGPNDSYHDVGTRGICEALPGASEFIREKGSKDDLRLRKTNAGKAEGLGVDPADYPQLHKAIMAGDIPVGVFFQPGGDQPVNREYLIWEMALEQKGWAPTIYEISQNASQRNTYERDITPYLSFLFKLPKYLDRHTPGRKKWKAVPKLVKSQWELEMEEVEEGATTKERSAFTPVADNETRTVMVPYTAVAVTGVYTTWCYSRHYYVFEQGMTDPESTGIVVQDLEEKLNGRDDYGLMYYTLSGSETSRGYPTFLIIFERLQGQTRVHFHRVHPCRSKKGVKTQACELVARCYQYMAGNIPAAEVVAQQGDLIFLNAKAMGKAVKEGRPVAVFESHRFSHHDGSPVVLIESTAKTPKNRLGYIDAKASFSVRHPEHEDIEELGPGLIEVRRCKSYENNPVAIWSLTID